MLRNREVQSALDGFGFGLGMQRSLGALDLCRIQLKVFVSSFGRCGHRITPLCRQYINNVHRGAHYVHLMEALIRRRPAPADTVSVTLSQERSRPFPRNIRRTFPSSTAWLSVSTGCNGPLDL